MLTGEAVARAALRAGNTCELQQQHRAAGFTFCWSSFLGGITHTGLAVL